MNPGLMNLLKGKQSLKAAPVPPTGSPSKIAAPSLPSAPVAPQLSHQDHQMAQQLLEEMFRNVTDGSMSWEEAVNDLSANLMAMKH